MSDETTTDTPGAGELDEALSMGIDPVERNWMVVSTLLLAGFFVVVTIAGFSMGFQVLGADDEVDPRTIEDVGQFAEPGVREVAPGRYEAYVVAKTWLFEPREIEIPVGSTVDIYVTSPDLQHGFKITDTNVNMQIVPGQVSHLSYTFDDVGEFPYICHEYCGQGHAAMWGVVRVVDPDADADQEAASE